MKVKRPTLLVDKQKVLRNIDRVVQKARSTNTAVYPHFKTHQSLQIGDWFNEAGIDGITVSSVSMARYFTDAGWQNIFIAFPVNINEIKDIAELSELVNLTLLVNEEIQVQNLIAHVLKPVKIKVEIETGSNRSGIIPDDRSKITAVLELISSSQHLFDGFYSHFGHTYRALGKSSVEEIFNRSFSILKDLQTDYEQFLPEISLGDTPSASVLTSYDGIKSMHAGNYVFYDLTQVQVGACIEDDIGIALAVPIVSKNQQNLELIVYGGGVHLSKEILDSNEIGQRIYGKIVDLTDEGWSNSLRGCYVKSISQEHGVVQVTQQVFDRFNVGDTVGILPVHSCMTADCMRSYNLLSGDHVDHFQGTPLLH